MERAEPLAAWALLDALFASTCARARRLRSAAPAERRELVRELGRELDRLRATIAFVDDRRLNAVAADLARASRLLRAEAAGPGPIRTPEGEPG